MGRLNKLLNCRWKAFAVAFALVLVFSACQSTTDQLQEQLDLGRRYLQELNYTEAIAAFTKAIEIDPRQVEAYVGRADAYVGLYENVGGDNLQLAQADYEEALRLDDQQVEVYLRLAALYIQQGETEKALDLMRRGYEATGDERLNTIGTTADETRQVIFEERDNYKEFTSLSADEQQAIRGAVAAIQSGDREIVRALVENIGLTSTIYTRVDGYKVMVYGSPMMVIFEIRPESGQGFSYTYSNVEQAVSESYQSFGCEGWQCSGEWYVEMSSQASAENGNGYWIQASGQAENNQGTATSESTLEWTGNDGIVSEIQMENGVITYAVVHAGELGDMEVPDAVGTKTEMMTMEWETW